MRQHFSAMYADVMSVMRIRTFQVLILQVQPLVACCCAGLHVDAWAAASSAADALQCMLPWSILPCHNLRACACLPLCMSMQPALNRACVQGVVGTTPWNALVFGTLW